MGHRYPLCLVVSVFSRSVFGLPFLVFGLYKGGFPDTLGFLLDAARNFERGQYGVALPHYLNGIGLVLHDAPRTARINMGLRVDVLAPRTPRFGRPCSPAQAMTCFAVCGWITHLFALTRPSLAPTSWLIMQHWFMMLKYYHMSAYIVVELALEVCFEWSLFANLRDVSPSNGYDRLARPMMLCMVASPAWNIRTAKVEATASPRLVFAEDPLE